MSTNALVAFTRSDGSIVSSYVHYDGYVTGVGETLLEYYNDEKSALGVSVGGYYSSLSEDLDASLNNSVHNEEPEMFDSFNEFRDYVVLNSHLEFCYLWLDGRWIFSSWNTEVIHPKPFTPEFGDGPRYETTFNGFAELIPAYVREGRKLVNRYRDIALEDNRDTAEYDEYADATEAIVEKWNRIGVSNVAREYMTA